MSNTDLPSYATRTPPAASARQQFDLSFQIASIVLAGGIAQNAEGGLLPITALYDQSGNNATTDPNAFFARYVVMPGGTLVSNAIGTYPFANAQVAANAIIQQPLNISVMMLAPVTEQNTYAVKLSKFAGLKASLQQHCASGGRFTIATPANIYFDCLLTSMTDATHSEVNPQAMYQIDFVQPLITLTAAAAAQAAMMQRITNGGKINGAPTWSGNYSAQGQNVNGLNAAVQSFGGNLQTAANGPAPNIAGNDF